MSEDDTGIVTPDPTEVDEVTQEEAVINEGTPANPDNEETSTVIPTEGHGNSPGVQKRIDKVTRDKHEAQREAQYYKGELARIAHERETIPLVKPNEDDFDDEDDYQEAKQGHALDVRMREHEQKTVQDRQAHAEQQEAQAAFIVFKERATAYSAKHEDFDLVVNAPNQPISSTMREVVVSSKNGPALAYYFGKNPIVAEQICGLSPIAAAVAIGNIEERLGVPAARKTTNAPRPHEPVKNSFSGNNLSYSDKNVDKMTSQERNNLPHEVWKSWKTRQEQRLAGRR